MPKITVKMRVRPAERHAGGWSIEYGPRGFTYDKFFTFDSFDAMAQSLMETAVFFTGDPRASNWPGVEVSAEPASARKPNGWDANRSKTVARVQIVGAAA